MLPDPSLLDSKTWEKGVFPNMGPRLGIFQYGSEIYPSNIHDLNLDSNFYPKQPVLGLEQWQNIIDYYTATSPDSLPKQDRKRSIQSTLLLFCRGNLNSIILPNNILCKNKWILLHPLIIGDAMQHSVYFLTRQLEIEDSLHYGPVVDIDFMQDKMLACDIGILNPNNGRFGKAQFVTNEHGKVRLDSTPLFGGTAEAGSNYSC